MIRSFILLATLLAFQAPAHAQARDYAAPEIDALLAPVALYPDVLLSHVLVSATYPADLQAAAAWSRANPQLAGEDAVRAAAFMPWHESVKALLAFPDLLYRMDESPQWTADLGAAFLAQEAQVMDGVQELRRRAQTTGYLQSNAQVLVQQQAQAIAIHPAQPQAIYLHYYNPYLVYGPVRSIAHRPVHWRPWTPRTAVFVSVNFFRHPLDWQRRHVSHDAPRRGVVQQVRPVLVVNHLRQTQLPHAHNARQTPSTHAHNARHVAPVAQISAQVQRPVHSPVAAPHPVAVRHPAHPPRAPRPTK